MRCKVNVSVCVCVCYVHTKCIYIRRTCMHARGSDMFACVRLQSIFVCQSPGDEREGAGAWQAEGQT